MKSHFFDYISNCADSVVELIDYVKFLAFGSLDLLEALVAHIKVLALEAYLHHLCLTFKN